MTKYSIIALLVICFCTVFVSGFVVAESPHERAVRVGATGSANKVVDDCTVRTTITRAEVDTVLGSGVTLKNETGSAISGDIPGGTKIQNQRDVCVYSMVKLAGRWLSIVAGTLAGIFVVLAGVFFMRAGGDTEKVKKAKAMLIGAIIGFLIAALGRTILRLAFNLFQ